MPPVCKFFLKGYCRYGNSCRFYHPGEVEEDNPQTGAPASGFSFSSALNSIQPEQPTFAPQPTTISSSFSFTRALETTTFNNDDVCMSDTLISNQVKGFSFQSALNQHPTVQFSGPTPFGPVSSFAQNPAPFGTSFIPASQREPDTVVKSSKRDSIYSELTDLTEEEITEMGDRYNIQSQLEHLQSKQIGTGHPDTAPHEMMVNQHRDTICTYLGRQDMLEYFAVAEGESRARMRFRLQKQLIQPCGPPPEKPKEEI